MKEKNAKKKVKVSWVISIFLSVLILSISFFFFQGSSWKRVTFSPEAVVEKKMEGRPFSLISENDEFKLYAGTEENGMALFAFYKRMGLWLMDYPHRYNIQGFSYLGDDLYYYGAEEGSDYSRCILRSDGEILMPETVTTVEGYTVFLYILEDYEEHLGVYRLATLDETGSVIPGETDPYFSGEIVLEYFNEGVPENIELHKAEIESYTDGKERLIPLFKEAVSTKILDSEKEEFSVSSKTKIIKQIHTYSNLGNYISVEGSRKAYRWNHTFSHILELTGENAGYLLQHEYQFFDKSLYDDHEGKREIYSVTIPDELSMVFDAYFQ